MIDAESENPHTDCLLCLSIYRYGPLLKLCPDILLDEVAFGGDIVNLEERSLVADPLTPPSWLVKRWRGAPRASLEVVSKSTNQCRRC